MNVHDVAAYILSKKGSLSAMTLQKLVYYSQAWSLVWDERPLFDERIEAWVNGPVSPDLYEKHKGKYSVTEWTWGSPDNLDDLAKETVDAVLEYYKKYDGGQLSALTHNEDPWKFSRAGLRDDERGNREITLDSMAEYYGGLLS